MLRARDNPFAADRVLRQRYRLDASGWALLLARLRGLRHRGAIVGAEGSGKTTLLEDLAARLERLDWRVTLLRLDQERPALDDAEAQKLAGLGGRDLVLLDGAEQLSRWQWWRLRWQTRRSGGLIITTHRAGRLPTLWRCRTTPDLLRELSSALGVPLTERESTSLFSKHRGNLRDALRELYDRFAAEHVG